MKAKHLIVIIYDGIKNSVFQSQVLAPLEKKLVSKEYDPITLISFEKFSASKKQLLAAIPPIAGLNVVVARKIPFTGTLSLWFAILQLKLLLRPTNPFNLLARGPLAGFIAKKIATHPLCTSLTIQARGLLAAEYAYSNQQAHWLKKIIHQLRTKQFERLEKQVYKQSDNAKICIEAVSHALGEYLGATFNANPQNITIAEHDLPSPISTPQKAAWRQQTRLQLGIPADAYVYCYNGSALPWQCPHETLQFFKNALHNNDKSFLLILSQDTAAFENIAKRYCNATHYKILSVAHRDIYQYLAAADAGILFREKNILNWVSRPTKVLEYQALELPIIHNNTVAWLNKENVN